MKDRMIIHPYPHPLPPPEAGELEACLPSGRERAGVRGRFVQVLFALVAACFCLLAPEARANNVQVRNIGLTDLNTANSNMLVEFDMAWENSWRAGSSWDAAWVFVKYKPQGSNEWYHATLSTNDSDHQAAAGSAIDTPSDGKGAFVYRSADGTGNVNYVNMGLRWNYGADGKNFQKGANVEVSVFAIEMVYIPQGSFYLGSGGGESSPFYKYPTTTDPYLVTNEDAITVGTATGNLYYSSSANFTVSNAFPKGYNAFYCMKYEISQGQYADFLNKLTSAQCGEAQRYPNKGGLNRHTISGSYTNFSASVPDRACNYISWADGAAYADWAALKPMTELEFEKACRGPETPVANEYAWGSNNIYGTAYSLTNNSLPNERVSNPGNGTGNASYSTTDGSIDGPLRCGIFAASKTNPSRAEAGATYYGVMEMSGNVFEKCVTVGNTTGQGFTGLHGDGVLTSAGDANVVNWPGTGAIGAGFRGGGWTESSADARVSHRHNAAITNSDRLSYFGWRAARLAPSG